MDILALFSLYICQFCLTKYTLLYLDYVAEIFSTLISRNRKDLEATEKKLKENVPEPAHNARKARQERLYTNIQIKKSKTTNNCATYIPTYVYNYSLCL